jgi:hypothetical protein
MVVVLLTGLGKQASQDTIGYSRGFGHEKSALATNRSGGMQNLTRS